MGYRRQTVGGFLKTARLYFARHTQTTLLFHSLWLCFLFLFCSFFFSIPLEGIQKKKPKKKKNTHTTTNCMTTTLVGSRMLWMPVSVITDCKTANTNNLLELQQKPKNFFFLSLEKKINEKEFFLGHIFSIICCSHCDFSASMIKVLY